MKKKIIVAVAALALIPAISACATSSSVNTTPDSKASTGSSSPAAAKTAHVGDSIAVSDDEGTKLQVTLVKVDPEAKATDNFSTPPAGDSYYAAQFEIKNIGSSAFSDDIGNDAKVMDAKGQQFGTDIVESISSGQQFQDTTNLAPGGSALGWVVFDVPTGDSITGAQFTTLSGMGNTAQWVIP